MRPIKFRAWHTGNKKMYYWGGFKPLVCESKEGIVRIGDDIIELWDKRDGVLNGDFQEIILMQFTGVLDIDKNEIYEGDFLRGDWNPYEVIFDGTGWNTSHNLPLWGFFEPKIIGNIYEGLK